MRGNATDDQPDSERAAPRPVGWRERVALPDLGVPVIKAKLDTGARTSALHAAGLEVVADDNGRWAYFDVRMGVRDRDRRVACCASVADERRVRDSGGHSEWRLIIETRVALGARAWPIEISLTERDTMLFPMLLGRTGMRGICIDPAASYAAGRPVIEPCPPDY